MGRRGFLAQADTDRLVLCLLGLEASVSLVADATLVLSWLPDRRADWSETPETRHVRTSRTVLVWPGRWAAQVGRGHLGQFGLRPPMDGVAEHSLLAAWLGRAWLHEPGLVGGHHGLDAVPGPELGQDPGDVGSDRGLGDH
jgi:hypothetical protein